eukprot:1097637-Prymnesium_polylepis.1
MDTYMSVDLLTPSRWIHSYACPACILLRVYPPTPAPSSRAASVRTANVPGAPSGGNVRLGVSGAAMPRPRA